MMSEIRLPVAWRASGEATSRPTAESASLLQLVDELHNALHGFSATLAAQNSSEGLLRTRRRLLLHARQAEAALRRLREVKLAPAVVTADVIQSLTVLVLSADMLAQGYLTDRQSSEMLSLLTRNVNRAIDGVARLREDMGRLAR